VNGTADNVSSDIARARRQMDEMGMDHHHSNNGNGGAHYSQTNPAMQQQSQQPQSDNALPDGWEEMTDATTGRKFYIDHATQTTTWERPTASISGSSMTHEQTSTSNNNNAMPIMKLNQYGSHSHWDDDIHTGSRSANGHHGGGENDNGYNHQNYRDSYESYSMDNGTSSSHKGPPPLDFVVVSVPDALRMECPGCYSAFTYTKRRHHCRLCGDVFCDACSSTRTVLPLDGPEFETPVRVCDWCMKDVTKGNYFSLRRYLTPLQLFDPTNDSKRKSILQDDGAGSGDTTKEITANTVAASLSSLSADIDAMVLEPMTFQEKITIPASVLVPAVGKHLKDRTTAEYAIRVLASLLMLGNVVGDDSFALAVYEGDTTAADGSIENSESTTSVPSLLTSSDGTASKSVGRKKPSGAIVNDVLAILEWNGTDDRSLSALEQAAKVIYYITEPNFIASAISKRDIGGEEATNNDEDDDTTNEENGPIDVDAVAESMHDFIQIDIHRAFRSMLDHATSFASASLQRWATASLRHLITEDRRRACVYSSGPSKYESFMTQLVSTGGIMILCSLLSSEDAETRTHATSTLEAIVISTREIGLALNSTTAVGGLSRVGRGTEKDSAIVDAIVSNGGCGPALAHLLISADESVAMLGCSFASSLISPLLTDPRGSSSSGADFREAREDDDGLSSYRHAALALVVGEECSSGSLSKSDVSCLPSLIQILRSGASEDSWGGGNNNPSRRSMKLQVVAGECLAAISLAIGHIMGATSTHHDSLYRRAKQALEIMETEKMFHVAYKLVTSASSRSLDPSRNTPQARLREAAGLTLLALSTCSSVSSSYLISNKAISGLLNIAAESLGAPSALRGEWASRGLCYLECAAQLLLRAWKNNDASCLNLLIDALDAGAVGLASRLIKAKVHLKHHDKAYSMMRIKIATCYMLSAMFGIARSDDKNALGASRLYSAVDADCAASLAYGNNESEGRTDLVASTVFLLSATLPYAQRFANQDADEPLPMMNLSEACLLAVGSMCGAATGCFANDSSVAKSSNFGEVQQDKYSHLRQDASSMACRALTTAKDRGTLLPSVLIGALGGSLVTPALRVTLAIAQNGHHELHGELASCGVLAPICDILQHSLSTGERYTFSVAIAIVRFCGPCANVERSNSGSIASLQNTIRTLSALMISESGNSSMNEQRQKALMSLKFESLKALEALSSNESLQSTMIRDAFPALTQFLIQLNERADLSAGVDTDDMVCSALKTIQSIISLPSSTSSVAVKGMISSLVKILNKSADNRKQQEVSLELLHAVTLGKSDIAGNGGLLSSGVMESVAALVGEGGMISPKVTLLCLDIIEFIISDIESTNSSHFNPSLKDTMLQQFVNAMASQEQFLRKLIATMVATNNANHDKLSISPLYGTPLRLPEDNGLHHAENKAIQALFSISSLLCSDVSGVGKKQFLDAFMLKDVRGAAETVSFACCVFLQILMDQENGLCVPQNPSDRAFFSNVKLPLIKAHLLEGLSSSLDECMFSTSSRKHAETLICDFKIPQLCLTCCQSKTVSQAAFDLYENIVLPLPIAVLGDLLLADKSSLVTLFDLVTGQNNMVPDHDHSKQTFAHTLGNFAKTGLLAAAVERFGVRNNAIAALSAAMQGSDDGNIDENEDSLPRICVESLAAILCDNEQDELELTALEARTMAPAIGKILSATILTRFFTQASLETTFDDSLDHSSDRSAISQSAEARLLCSLASFPETLDVLRKVGGLEAIGLIAHEGELAAIQALQKACELSPKSVVAVDAHLSIMDCLIQVESKLPADLSNASKLREVVIGCIQIITSLSQNIETKSAVLSAEQSFGCLKAATCIISAISEQLSQKSKAMKGDIASVNKTLTESYAEEDTTSAGKSHIQKTEKANEDLQLGDLVLVDSTFSSNKSSPSKSDQSHDEQLEGIVAHLGDVEFAPGDDWIGIQLTGSSVGLGRNDGRVKGVRYFECGDNERNGVFVKRDNVEKQKCQAESEAEKETEIEVERVTEKIMPPSDMQQEQMWGCLLLKDDFTLEIAAFLLLLSFSSSKTHRDLLMQMETLIDDMTSVIQLQSPTLSDFQCRALDLVVSFTLHLHKTDIKSTNLFCLVVESQTRVLQITRDKREQMGSKQLLVLAISGLRNTFSSFMGDEEKVRSLKIASDLFVFLVDSLYKGSKYQRSAASMKDGVLFYQLSSFFVLSIGSESLMDSTLSVRFVSSSVRFIMMTSGVTSFACHIPIAVEGEREEYWNAALSHCLYCLSCNIAESSQDHLGISYSSLILDVEAQPNSFQFCLKHIANSKLGTLSISSKEIVAKLDSLL